MRMPSCSGLQRFIACSGSALVEQAEETERGAAAKRGDIIHAVIAARLMGKPDPDMGRYRLPLGPSTMEALRRNLGDGELHAEEAYSYDGERVEVLGLDIGRAYGRPNNLNGSADIVVIRENAMVVSLAYPSVKTATGAIAKLETNGEWTWSQHMWDRDALAAIRVRLDRSLAALRVNAAIVEAGIADAPVTPGTHCAYARCVCPHAMIPQHVRAA